ncbi:MAG TPA: hypothetical protein PKY99_00065 [Turneriella sp.]|nr:hypothetical protein [Turneriella sp.]
MSLVNGMVETRGGLRVAYLISGATESQVRTITEGIFRIVNRLRGEDVVAGFNGDTIRIARGAACHGKKSKSKKSKKKSAKK